VVDAGPGPGPRPGIAFPGLPVVTAPGVGALTTSSWRRRAASVAAGLGGRLQPGDRVGLAFGPDAWTSLAVAWLGVGGAEGVAVVVAPAALADRRRALAGTGVVGVVGDAGGAALVAGTGAWSLTLDELEGAARQPGAGEGHAGRPPAPGLLARAAPLRPPVVEAEPVEPEPGLAGPLVHTWAPGSAAAQRALRAALAGVRVVAVAGWQPPAVVAAVATSGARTLGLTPASAAVLLAAGVGAADLPEVAQVILDGRPRPSLSRALAARLPAAAVVPSADGAPLGPPPAGAPLGLPIDVAPLGPPAAGALPGPPAGGPPPVAVSQESMLWHEQLVPGSFNLPCLVRRYRGRLDVGALERALTELARRHEPLRTTFTLAPGGEARMVVAAQGPALARLDLEGRGSAEAEAAVADHLAEATGRPFDLSRDPLFAPTLVRLGPEDHLLAVRLHHTAFDDWSVDVLRRELSALYAAELAGQPSPLLDPPVSFSAFARRQRHRLAGGVEAEQRRWWRSALAGGPLAVQLPIGDPQAPPGTRSRPGPPVTRPLPPSLAAGVRDLAPGLRATPYMTVLAAFAALVGAETGLGDVVVGTVVAHRPTPATEGLIGCFTKKVPVRVGLGGEPSFADLVGRTRRSLLEALAHQDLAFDAAVGEGLGRAAADHGVVAQVAVVFQGETPRRQRLSLPGLEVGPYEAPPAARTERHFATGGAEDEGPAWGDVAYRHTFLLLSLVEEGTDLSLVARGAFHPPAVRALLERLESLLGAAVAGPGRGMPELLAAAGVGGSGPDPAGRASLRGFAFRPDHLEAALARVPGVAEVAVAVRPGPDGQDRLVAYTVPGGAGPSETVPGGAGPSETVPGGAGPSLTDLRLALWAEHPGAPWPSAVVRLAALPRTPAGDLDTAALVPLTAADCAPAPAHPDAEALAAVWAEVAGRPVSPTDAYSQDLSFLLALAEARAAGFDATDAQVARNRTLDALALDVAAARIRRRA